VKLATLSNRAAEALGAGVSRRGLLSRSAMAATALSVAPVRTLLRPDPAYAQVCGCSGSSCSCGSLCCDGYTEFCCTITGANSCPPGAVLGGWWKVEGHSRCGGSARYYMDCHRTCGSCGCGSSGLCTGACSNTSCGCANGSCGNRKAGCTRFRYGNCASNHACLGPIVCRVVTCRAPWTLDATCTTTPRVDNNTRSHHRPCLEGTAVTPVTGDWNGNGGDGVGVFWHATRRWELRQTTSGGAAQITFGFGGAGDIPVVGDWDGDGIDGIGVFRPASREWLLRDTPAAGGINRRFGFGGVGDIPVVGDWNGDGIDGIGVYRPSTGEWLLRNTASGGGIEVRFGFGGRGDIPVVGDWNGDGRDGIGVFRPSSREWLLRDTASGGSIERRFGFGAAGDRPVVGNWDGIGSAGIGVFRDWSANWLLRQAPSGGGVSTQFEFGPRDY
jgi:hypothetical protein